jgi:hypothetical protein
VLSFDGLVNVGNAIVTLNGTNRIGVSWDAAEGASSYKIMYKKSTASTFLTLYKSIPSTSFIAADLDSGTTYLFR